MRFISILAVALLLTGCAEPKAISGKVYKPYGLLNAASASDPAIEYEIVWGNVIWGGALAETVVAPIYFFGFSIFEPVRLKHERTST